jgi:hypothetical protein
VIEDGAMRKLADRHRIRKRSFEVDRKDRGC